MSRLAQCSRKASSSTRTYRSETGEWLLPSEVKIEGEGNERTAIAVSNGRPVTIGSPEKMSKSRKNVVDPDDIIEHYGADTARLFIVSDSPRIVTSFGPRRGGRRRPPGPAYFAARRRGGPAQNGQWRRGQACTLRRRSPAAAQDLRTGP